MLQIGNGSNAKIRLSRFIAAFDIDSNTGGWNAREGKITQTWIWKTILDWWRKWLCYCLTQANNYVNTTKMKFAKVHWHQFCVSAWYQIGLMNTISTDTCEDGSLMNLTVCHAADFFPAWLTKVCLKQLMGPLFGYPIRNWEFSSLLFVLLHQQNM